MKIQAIESGQRRSSLPKLLNVKSCFAIVFCKNGRDPWARNPPRCGEHTADWLRIRCAARFCKSKQIEATPDVFRPPKLSGARPGQYLRGVPGKTSFAGPILLRSGCGGCLSLRCVSRFRKQLSCSPGGVVACDARRWLATDCVCVWHDGC